jgi:hypothetical protein
MLSNSKIIDKSVCKPLDGFIIIIMKLEINLKRLFLISLIFLSLVNQVLFSFTTNNFLTGEESISINVVNNIDLPEIVSNMLSPQNLDNQVIKFEITCSVQKSIIISMLTDISNTDFIFDTEWKVGPYTGFENQFISGGVYTPENKKYYVTIKIKSLQTKQTASKGTYTFTPTISVEYLNN